MNPAAGEYDHDFTALDEMYAMDRVNSSAAASRGRASVKHEAARHDGTFRRCDTRAELVRHVDHADPLHIFVSVDPFDEPLLQ